MSFLGQGMSIFLFLNYFLFPVGVIDGSADICVGDVLCHRSDFSRRGPEHREKSDQRKTLDGRRWKFSRHSVP